MLIVLTRLFDSSLASGQFILLGYFMSGPLRRYKSTLVSLVTARRRCLHDTDIGDSVGQLYHILGLLPLKSFAMYVQIRVSTLPLTTSSIGFERLFVDL